MSYPHLIRLRGPWQYEVIETGAPVGLPLAGQMVLPADWGRQLGVSFRGRVRFTRNFGRPPGLEPHERVRLVCDGIDPHGAMLLGGQRLGNATGYALPCRADVTELLKPRNTVELNIDFPAGSSPPRPGREQLPGGPVGEVRLEILSTNWLDDFWMEVRDDGRQAMLRGGGLVAGAVGDHPLELVIRTHARELYYTTVEPGRAMQFETPADDLPHWAGDDASPLETLTVKLIGGASAVWQRKFSVARRHVAWQADSQTLRMDGIAYDVQRGIESSLPRPPHESSTGNALTFATQVCPEDWYVQQDRAVRAVVQQVPSAWSPLVCRRLAHHPSIVAWATSPADLKSLPTESVDSTYDRPWITCGR